MKRGVILLLITLGLIAYLISPAKAAPSKSLIPLTPPLSAANPALITTAETARLTLTPTLELTATGSVQVITGRLEVTEAQQANPWRTYARTDCIRDLAAGQEVWVATCGGVLRWDQTDGSYIHYTNADGLPDNDIQAIVIDLAGHIWVSTGPGGVSEFDGRTWLTHMVRDTEAGEYYDRAMTVDQAGHVWVNTTGGLSEFDGQRWTTHPLAENLANSSIRAIAGDPAGHIWLGVYGGVSQFDGQNWTSYTTANGLVNDDVTALAVDSAGHIWVGTHSGVNMFDGQNWLTYTAADGLMDNRVTDIALDPTGQVWASHLSQTVQTASGGFAREGGGVSRFDGQTWDRADEGLAEAKGITALALDPRDSSTLYALVQFPKTGTSLHQGKAGTPWLALPSPLPNTPLNSGLALDGAKGVLYVTTGSQLWRSSNPAAPEVKGILWELVHDFGPDVQAELLASGWSPEGLALYANLTKAQDERSILYRSLDGGQTWGPLGVDF